MKRIIITRMKLVNFKGIRELEIFPDKDVTKITGDNGQGKSTVMAAFSWLLTGKDQYDSADMDSFKTYDGTGAIIPQLEHYVEAELLINGRTVVLKRETTEIWVTRRGETERTLDRNKTSYYVGSVACGTEREFREEVESIIVSEKIFKLLSNPLYFSSILPWTERRELLFQIVPPAGEEEVLDRISQSVKGDRLAYMKNLLSSGEKLERIKKDLSARRKETKDRLDKIPAMIAATERTKPDQPDGGFGVVEYRIEMLNKELKSLDEQIADASKVDEAKARKTREKQEFINKLRLGLQAAEYDRKAKTAGERRALVEVIEEINTSIDTENRAIQTLQKEINENTRQINTLADRKEFAEKRAPELEKKKQELIEKFNEVNDRVFVFSSDDFSHPCPTCLREYTAADIETKEADFFRAFNEKKSKDLDFIDTMGMNLKKEIEQYRGNISKFDSDIAELEDGTLSIAGKQAAHKSEIDRLSERLNRSNEELKLFDKRTDVQSGRELKFIEEIKIAESPEPTIDDTADPIASVLEEKKEKQSEVDGLKQILARREAIEKADRLIAEYRENEKKLAQEIATLEGREDAIGEYTRAQVESTNEKLSGLFRSVRIRMFRKLMNGEYEPCCEVIDGNGVPFGITNTAMKTNCGLDIIGALQQFYGISMPILIDNKESITKLFPADAQIILLEKVSGQKELQIN